MWFSPIDICDPTLVYPVALLLGEQLELHSPGYPFTEYGPNQTCNCTILGENGTALQVGYSATSWTETIPMGDACYIIPGVIWLEIL